jgi:hypothetical protein
MKTLFHLLSRLLLVLATASLAFLLFSDVRLRFQLTASHQRASALALMFVGASFVSVQLGSRLRGRNLLRDILLGLAFVLWGGEQFLPPDRIATAIDSVVIAIFVFDLGSAIRAGLSRKDADPSPGDAAPTQR